MEWNAKIKFWGGSGREKNSNKLPKLFKKYENLMKISENWKNRKKNHRKYGKTTKEYDSVRERFITISSKIRHKIALASQLIRNFQINNIKLKYFNFP